MPKKQSPYAQIALTALDLAEDKGWANVKIADVAKVVHIAPKAFCKEFAAMRDLLPIIIEYIDREAITAMGKPSGAPRDILFDLVMHRFDVLQKHRDAILSIADAARIDPQLSIIIARQILPSANRLATATRLPTPRSILSLGLASVQGYAFLVWRRDQTLDMAKTMAAVDRGLGMGGKILGLIKPYF